MTFIEITDKDGKNLVNVRHINAVYVKPDGLTHIGINNYGASGFDVEEPYPVVRDMIATAIVHGKQRGVISR